MFRGFFTRYRLYYCAHIPGLTNTNFLDNPEQLKQPEPKNGVERVVALFHPDEQGELRKEVVSAVQISISSGFLLAFYGGGKHSKGAFENWITLNTTTRFRTAYQAKRALHDFIALEFAKHFFIYGAKGFAFTSILMFTLIAVSAYRDKNGILEYSIAGILAGSLMRITYGLKGMISGAIVGGGLSTITGICIYLLTKMANISIDDVRKWQYDMRVWRKKRLQNIQEQTEDDTLTRSFKYYTSKLTQTNSEEDEDKVFVLVNTENQPVMNSDTPTTS